jgi:hypothetical protein
VRGVGERSIGVACMSPIGAHPQRVVSPTKTHLFIKSPTASHHSTVSNRAFVVHLLDVQRHCLSLRCADRGNLANYFGVCKITLTEYA